MKDNIQLIKEFGSKMQKAFFGSGDLSTGGAMNPNVATEFFQQVREQSDFLNSINVKITKENTAELDTIEFIEQFLKIPTEGVELVDTTKPTTARTTVLTHMVTGQVDLTYEAMLDVIEEEAKFKSTVGNLITKAFSRDLNKMLLSGIDLGGGAVTVNDLLDGFIHQAAGATGLHKVDAFNGVDYDPIAKIDTDGTLYRELLKAAIAEVIDWGVLERPSEWWFLCHPHIVLDYQDVVSKVMHAVSELAAADRINQYRGIPLVSVQGMPDYVAPYADTFATTGNSTVLLAEKRNMVAVFQKRNVWMEEVRQPLKGIYSFVVRARVGCGYYNLDRVAAINNVLHIV